MAKKLTFAELNTRLQGIFETEENFEGFKNARYDLNRGLTMYDEDGKVIPKHEAEKSVRNYVWAILGLDENSTKRDRKRAMKKHGVELYEVLEEDIDFKVETGFKDNEFFNAFVENRNLKRGDSQEFWTDEEVILSVSKIAGDSHDFLIRRVRIA